MIAAAAALFGSEIVLGGRAFVVRPPSVLTALAVEAAVEHGGTETDRLLAEACAGPDAAGRPWMPPSMRSVLFSPAVRPQDRARVIETALLAGVPDERVAEARRMQEAARHEARGAGWGEVLARYRATFSPADVLAEPWPFFLAQSDQIRPERARQSLDWAHGYLAARSGREAWRALERVAGVAAVAPPPSPEEAAHALRVRAQLEAMRQTGSTLNWNDFMPPAGEA